MAKFSDESVRAALRGRQVMRRYPFPGQPQLEVGVKLLSDAELDIVRLQAVEDCKRHKAELVADPEFLDRVIHRETIARAFCDVDAPDEPFFGSQSSVAELDNLTVRSLFELYVFHAQAMDPYAYCPPEEVEALAETMGKSENAVGLLSLYDLLTARSFVLSLALRLRETQQQLK
jgi:hypothetical protein